MADSASIPNAVRAITAPRHTATVRATHWIATLCFFALLLTGVEILISHPRFYWGETGNVLMPSLFDLPIPASRGSVKTGYSFVLKDQNGWSRSLHFQAGWFLVFTGLFYGAFGLLAGHFRRNLLPAKADRSWSALAGAVANQMRSARSTAADTRSYNLLQRISYLIVIFVLFPLVIWTGLAMSAGFTAAFPFTVNVFGGQQSARTIHFFVTVFLVLFLLVHVGMVCLAGFRDRMRAMITGRVSASQEHR